VPKPQVIESTGFFLILSDGNDANLAIIADRVGTPAPF
jgi:hypothetical protein